MRTTRIYLDHAAASPELPAARRASLAAAKLAGNPSSIHLDGLESARALAAARLSLAASLSASAKDIVLVGSGTESDNLAIAGSLRAAARQHGGALTSLHAVTTAIEHPAVIESFRALEAEGLAVTYLPVGTSGLIDLKDLRSALRAETALVSITYANSEIGTLQSVREIAKEIRRFKKLQSSSRYPLFHTDACQAAAYENLNVEQLGVDLLTLNGSKLGGPRGVGLLYVRRGTPVNPIIQGGGQELGLRSGTENVPAAAGLAAALAFAQNTQAKETARLAALQKHFFEQIEKKFTQIRINGSREHRLPNNAHISIPNLASELLVLELDARGISASAGSACSSAKETGSHVLEALYGAEDEKNYGSIRFSMGRTTTKREINAALSAIAKIIEKYRAL